MKRTSSSDIYDQAQQDIIIKDNYNTNMCLNGITVLYSDFLITKQENEYDVTKKYVNIRIEISLIRSV